MSNTARMAHYVIPDFMAMESPGTTMYTEYTKYYGLWTHAHEFPYAMYSPALVAPPEGADLMEPAKVFQRIARKLGLQLVAYANPAGVGQHWEKPPVAIPLPSDRDVEAEELIDILATGSRVSMDEIRRHPHGKIYPECDDIVLPREPTCDARMDLAAPSMMAELGEIFATRGDVPEPGPEYPLVLITRRANEFYNTTGRHNPALSKRRPYNPAFLAPNDLAALKVSRGDVVRVRSAHGSILAVVDSDDRLRPGTLSMSHCFGNNVDEEADPLTQGSCTGALLDANAEFDPLFGQPRMNAVPVAVEKLTAH
jgi:anaerobic selenocysteine-containing dehydrogenase